MLIAIKSLGIIITLMGVAYLLRPGIIKGFMDFFKKGRDSLFAHLLCKDNAHPAII